MPAYDDTNISHPGFASVVDALSSLSSFTAGPVSGVVGLTGSTDPNTGAINGVGANATGSYSNNGFTGTVEGWADVDINTGNRNTGIGASIGINF